MKSLCTRLVALATLMLVAACNESPTPTGVSPELAISDGAHDGGNQHFFFLPPMLPNPGATGTFAGDQEPVVEICVWDGSECGAALELYNMETGPGSETIRVDLDAEQYIVNWHTDDILDNVPIDVDAGESYRIRVLVGAQVLGYADVQVVDKGRQLKNVDTDEYIALLDGRTLPIKFRIEEGFEPEDGIVGVSAGRWATCAVDVTGAAYCWGRNIYGHLGIGIDDDVLYNTPQLVTGGHTFASVSNGVYHSCGVTTDGDAYCWGYQRYGQLGDGSSGVLPRSQPTPVLVGGGHTFASITTGLYHTCGVTTDGDGYCWGHNGLGQLGTGPASSSNPLPVSVSGAHAFQAISSEYQTTCGLTTAGEGYCWGWNAYGMVGAGSTDVFTLLPTAIGGGYTFQSLEPGWYSSCGVTTASVALCWGHNIYGSLGAGFTTPRRPYSVPNPVEVTGNHSFTAVRVGWHHACAMTTDGQWYCWGDNRFGQLGNGTRVSPNPIPGAIFGDRTFLSLDTGTWHTCGVTTDSDAFCWGANFYGNLGDGTFAIQAAPVFVLDLDPS